MSTSYYSATSLSASLDLHGDPPNRHRRPRVSSPQPSFARAVSIPSSRNSPISPPYHFGSNGSLQSTPEGMLPVSHLSLPMPPSLNLPEPILVGPISNAPTSSPSASVVTEALSKGPALIRRVSQSMPNKFRRNGSHAQRDKSSGPVVMRRRNGSRSAADGIDNSDLDVPHQEEEALEDAREPANAPGMRRPRATIPDSTAVAPTRNSRLEQGTELTKLTKKETRTVMLRLDWNNAKVSWDTSKTSKPSKAFYIDDVKEIRWGPEAKHYREECGYPESVARLWFTIIYADSNHSKGKIKAMHLLAAKEETVKMWTSMLDTVSRSRIDMMAGLSASNETSARAVWKREMDKKFGSNERFPEHESMNLSETIRLCRNLHINCSEQIIAGYFDQANRPHTGSLNSDQFLSFVRLLKERNDIRDIYDRLATEDRPDIDRDTFFTFLREEQGVNVDANLESWTAYFDKMCKSSKPRATTTESDDPPTMAFSGFQTFMTSSANSCFLPEESHHRLDRPLNEYFISSSHNTYLLGRQVIGESSTEAYITALQKGCRCIEIDCWNGSDSKPIVNHGRTFTTSILFSDAIKVINQYAFCKSDTPLIISLEVHCNPEQQALMAQIMIDEFGDKLVLAPLNWDSTVLPTPDELRNRILIKVKAAAEELDTMMQANESSYRRRDRSSSLPAARPVQMIDNGAPGSPLLVSSPPSMSPPDRPSAFWGSPRTSTTSTNVTIPNSALVSSTDESDSPHTTEHEDKRKKRTNTSKIFPVLGELGVYTKGIKFSSFRSFDASTYNHVFSLNERTFARLTKSGSQSKQSLCEHNMRYLMRVYPSGHRINSSNFHPLAVWRRGVQMAALNWQTYDLGQQLNEAMFAGGNDRKGYVLKPAELRLEAPTSALGLKSATKRRVRLAVEIISARQLPRPKGLSAEANINPYVEFEMHCAEDLGGKDAARNNGYPGVGEPVRKRTAIVENNGYDPRFKDNKFTMAVTTRYPSLVFVRWTIWNSRDSQNPDRAPLATFTAKLSNLQQGYRHLPLFDSNGEQYLFSTLFCRIQKDSQVHAIETIPERTGGGWAPSECPSPGQDAASLQTGRSLLKRLIQRTNSGGKRRRDKDERISSESKESELDLHSRSSTGER